MNRNISMARHTGRGTKSMSLFEPLHKSDEAMPLDHEITQLADHYAELDSAQAFLLESLTSVMSSQDPARENVIQGAKQFSEAVQARGRELKMAIDRIRERARAEALLQKPNN